MCNSPRPARHSKRRQDFTQVLAIVFAVGTILGVTGAAIAQQDQQDLSAMFDEAGNSFKPVTPEELDKAGADLDARMTDVERFVRPTTRNGQQWLRYLKWEELKNALASEGPTDLRALTATNQKLNRDENGLEARRFRRLASALRRYMQLAQIARQDNQEEYYRTQLDAMRKQLEDYRNEQTNVAAAQIGARLNFVRGVGNSPELVSAIKREFVQPNAYMDMSTELIAAGVDPINRREPVTDCILGTNIRSDARTTGTVGVATIPSENSAVIEFISDGRTRSTNVGRNGPAVIRSTAYTDFTATKRVELNDDAFASTNSRSHATTDTHLHSVAKSGGGLGSRLVSNIGWRRARQNERRAESIAADHAEDRIDRRFNEEVNKEVRDARRRYEEEYRWPLERRGEVPEHIRFSSDKDSVSFEVAQASDLQLAAPSAPPEAPAGHDMSLRLHESAVNNYSASLLSGATGTQTKPDEDIKFDVKVPKWMKDAWKNRKVEPTEGEGAEEPFKPYSITFQSTRPLSVNFVDGKVKLTVHIARLVSGDNTFEDWDVTGTYTPEQVNGGIVLRREEDLVMLPANFRGQLSSRQVAERRNLEIELNARSAQGRGFPKSFELEPLEPENLADAGPLVFNQFDSGNGWLTVAWDRQQKSNAQAERRGSAARRG
jgi:hypothetical protein